MGTMTTHTPLHAAHLAMGAKMIDFYGWNMPLHYGSQLNEHHAVRRDAGMFDVSHMNIVDIHGTDTRSFLKRLLTNDVDKLSIGKALYSCMCTVAGGIVDDLIVYQRENESYRLVLNSATYEKDMTWIYEVSKGLDLVIQPQKTLSMIAVQGPLAIKKIARLFPAVNFATDLPFFSCLEVGSFFIARTGYTGEDGLEIILPASLAEDFWRNLAALDIHPCGLGARDTLRLEAGLLLYGQDMDEHTSPLVSGLDWTVDWTSSNRDFIGKTALCSQKKDNPSFEFVGLMLKDKGIMRAGQRVVVETAAGKQCGVITSGSYSPTLGASIALARIPSVHKEKVFVDIRNKLIPAIIGKPRFVKRGKILWQL